ncbi:glyoxalase-like domain protein [Arenibacter sp. NBRC 103722]|uniref:VOC family protein n=1 Tax=Arenibacter sp. NBRC 103722 TaxID=1113929 RepID=UPI0008539C4F|nr:VOC family protein [Arenibacter sp. NBRC 103722]GBF22532.1 glyoxalase-like domain protein [Arenibacter sp. NBRC 103722]
MKNTLFITIIALSLGITACKDESTSASEANPTKETTIKIDKNMNSYVSIFEIPATDISRAINFYKEILGVEIERLEFPGMEMGLFPYQDQMVTGVIMKGEGYEPSAKGVTIYLNGGDNLQTILDKVEGNGGKIIVPKSLHADESGYYALFLDSEGNKMGLHSPN